jgi:hypothetical protein
MQVVWWNKVGYTIRYVDMNRDSICDGAAAVLQQVRPRHGSALAELRCAWLFFAFGFTGLFTVPTMGAATRVAAPGASSAAATLLT